jgi:hypothetical protein
MIPGARRVVIASDLVFGPPSMDFLGPRFARGRKLQGVDTV